MSRKSFTQFGRRCCENNLRSSSVFARKSLPTGKLRILRSLWWVLWVWLAPTLSEAYAWRSSPSHLIDPIHSVLLIPLCSIIPFGQLNNCVFQVIYLDLWWPCFQCWCWNHHAFLAITFGLKVFIRGKIEILQLWTRRIFFDVKIALCKSATSNSFSLFRLSPNFAATSAKILWGVLTW